MLRTIKERKEKLFSACYIGLFGKQQLATTMMMNTNEKNEKKKVRVCVCVHVYTFILRLIEEKKKENNGLFNLAIKETSTSN
jgi:predicted secreted protein